MLRMPQVIRESLIDAFEYDEVAHTFSEAVCVMNKVGWASC
jgi:hypothetical protein